MRLIIDTRDSRRLANGGWPTSRRVGIRIGTDSVDSCTRRHSCRKPLESLAPRLEVLVRCQPHIVPRSLQPHVGRMSPRVPVVIIKMRIATGLSARFEQDVNGVAALRR